MKQILIISGKGGTGKTVITASFASLVQSKVMADCDVDAADLHFLLKPTIKETHEFRSGKTAVIDEDQCIQCGKCEEVCRYDAIENFVIDSISCEGCGVCSYICPAGAIKMEENLSGEWFISDTRYGTMVHAKLGIAEENSGKLVTLVKQNAKLMAEKENRDYVIIDGPPGIGCPVIASLSGTNLALIITEPTLSGIHDLERVCQVTKHFGVKTFVCINKYDLNLENTQIIKEYCRNLDIKVVGEIPFDSIVTEALVKSIPVVEYKESEVSERIRDLWSKVAEAI